MLVQKLKEIRDYIIPVKIKPPVKVDVSELISPFNIWLRTNFEFTQTYKFDVRDRYVWVADLEDLRRIIQEDWLPKRGRYLAEILDCDDFAWRFLAFLGERYDITGLAYVESNVHAFNFIYQLRFSKEGKVVGVSFYLLEPQNGMIASKPEDTGFPEYYKKLDDVRL